MFNWVAGPPDSPKILYDNSTISGRNASVKWTSPEHYNCNITMYSICYRETEPSVNGWKQLNVSVKQGAYNRSENFFLLIFFYDYYFNEEEITGIL